MRALRSGRGDPTVAQFAPVSRSRSRPSVAGSIAAAVLAVCGVGLVLSAVVDLGGEGSDAAGLALVGGTSALGGVALRRIFVMPRRVPAAAALHAVVVAAICMIACSTVAYLVTGTLDRVDDALFESTAGFTTTALTVIPDLEALDHGVLFWRALTQWLGGFGALVTIVAVLPFLGVGGPQPTEARPPQGASHLFSPHVRRILRQYLAVYAGLTVVGMVLFGLGGMSGFDAVTYSFTTISTGGFGNHDRSFAHFDSALVEWMGIGGMFLGGLSLALLWRALRGRTRSLLQSAELWTYLGIVVVASGIVWLVNLGERGLHETARHSIFSVVSAVSTTGHTVTDWTAWAWGAQVVLLVVIGVGAMSGSLGGGFRIIRAMALFSYIGRELLRQLQPRSVRVVRVGRVVIDEQLADRMIGYQVLFLLVGGLGTLGLALFGSDILTAISGSVSGLATMGPALGDMAPGTGARELSDGARAVLLVVMLAGRVEVYPVLNALEGVAERAVRLRRRLAGGLRRS